MKLLRNKIVFFTFIILLIVASIALLPKRVSSENETESINAVTLPDHAVDLAKTIALVETSGTLNCAQIGLSGEKGCHQFLPSTWTAYSKDVYGVVVVQTPQAAQYVTETKIRQWIAQGFTDRQIFLIWNSGHPDHCSAGINSHGVHYDSCAYVQTALSMLSKVIHRG